MADTLKIASKSPMPLRMELYDVDGAGNRIVPDVIVIKAAGAEAGFPEGVTDGVDADLYNKWVAANPDHDFVAGGIIRVVGEDEPVTTYGFEAGLEAAAADTDNTALAEQGSTVTEEGPVSAEDMAAHSDTPNTDLPTSDVNSGLETPAQVPVASKPEADPAEETK